MSEKKRDRLFIEKKDVSDFNRLKDKDSPFSGAQSKDIFLAAMVMGFNEGSRITLKHKEEYVWIHNLKSQEISLIRSIAVYEEKTLDVLLNKDTVFSIAEEYASGGIKQLTQKVFSGEYGTYAKKLENDLLHKFEKIKKENSIKNDPSDDKVSTVSDLLAKGESNTIEFKSSLLWDYIQQKRTKIPGIAVAKAISSFMNANGGFLLIGIEDKKKILGLENDLKLLKNKSLDEFELQFTDLFGAYLNKICRACAEIKFEQIDDKYIAIIKVQKSPRPIYLKTEGKTEFYIRSGNSSQPLDISEATVYIRDHWS